MIKNSVKALNREPFLYIKALLYNRFFVSLITASTKYKLRIKRKCANHKMTYEWGYTYGPPMAVAPINEVERVLKYAVSVIPSRKILMGMPNYGYDWTLPYRRGSRANAISNLQAVNLAINNGATIQYDEKAQAPFFYYTGENGARHVVWFDDARSLTARLKLIEKYNLGGVSYWTINRLFRTNWYTLRALYDVNR